MIITGSVIMVTPGTCESVKGKLLAFPQVTFQGQSDSGIDMIVNIETDNHNELEGLCQRIKGAIPEIVDIGHIYINFEDEIEKIQTGTWPDYFLPNE
ncbi:MAG: chaperone NapD [Desulfomonilaceae bacterium]